ncbi:MAG: hypothetical protein IIB41_00180, partial [Candidatus Marinimicrobia bacterium]|nr:hypothetical protein [Candidatus Neomarinimicrobiota bacterium]
MKPEDKQELIDLINSDDGTADQVFKILKALSVAQITGQAIISPRSKESPIVIISYTKELKDMIEAQLEGTGVRATWIDD